ncbi:MULTISPECIES: hypothetical protein [unclassified Neptuniibacter]|uniref:hypothetical protein n=1 Tax=unclassified Neptuniibacter TaxID=2630693 RepID=UPI000C680991|nr:MULTISPECIES: hypothetical protein [unclassified Neptuniibacter]MAY42414.1 hypothetical protein [Oceanospirillaceae bacterium]|tara:strand:+ start:32229 stop:32567 length:339 start_codon:yes stop_codon:yes gene_type:complete
MDTKQTNNNETIRCLLADKAHLNDHIKKQEAEIIEQAKMLGRFEARALLAIEQFNIANPLLTEQPEEAIKFLESAIKQLHSINPDNETDNKKCSHQNCKQPETGGPCALCYE